MWIPPWISQVEYLWSEPSLERVMERLTRFARVITFDRRGSGLSDPFWGAPTLEEQMDDVLAVMDAAGSERAAIVGTLEGGPMAAMFAATHPDRVERARPLRHLRPGHLGAGLRVGLARGGARRRDGPSRSSTGARASWPAAWLPAEAGDPRFLEWAGRLERLAAQPGARSGGSST